MAQSGWIGPIGPPRKIDKISTCFRFFRPTQKMASDGPKWGRELFFPTNPDLANILGDTDFDFWIFYFWDFFGTQISQISKFPGRASSILLQYSWLTLDFFIFFYGFLVIPWPFLGSGGVLKWSWAIGLRPVLIWAPTEPYGPISDQISYLFGQKI